MKFSEVIEKLKGFYQTENLDELSEKIGIKVEDLKLAFMKKDLETINKFFLRNKRSLLPILRQNGKIDDEKENNILKYRLRKYTVSSRLTSNAISDLKELYETDEVEVIANKINMSIDRLNELIENRDYETFIDEMYLKYDERKDAVEYILVKAELRLKFRKRKFFLPENIEDKYAYFQEMLVNFNRKKVIPENHKAVFKRKVYTGGIRKVNK